VTTLLLIRAAELIEHHAESLRRSCTLISGQWNDEDAAIVRAHANYDEMINIAHELREKERSDIAFANSLSEAFNSGDGSYRP
jgi:hypothetical protein